MTKAERGELAFKIAGIVWVLRCLPVLSALYHLILQEAHTHFDAGGRLDAAAGLVYQLAVTVVPPICLIGFSRRLSRWLLRPRETDFASIFEEALHTGIVLIGLSFALAYAFAVLLVFEGAAVLAPWGAGTVVALSMLASAGHLTRFLQRWGRRSVEGQNASAGIVRVGLALMGLYLCLRSVIGGTSALAMVLWPPAENALFGETVRTFQVRQVYTNAAYLAVAIALVLSAPRVAAWLCRGETQLEGDRPSTSGPGARTYVELTLFAGLVYVFVDYFSRRMGPPFSQWQGRDVIRVVAVTVAMLALGMGVFYVGRLCLVKVAGWLVPGDSASEEANGARALVILEVPITIIAVHRVASDLLSLSSIVAEKALPEAAVISLGIILLRSDIAWLMLGRRRPSEAICAERRAAALRPWLILLGVWLVVVHFPGAPAGLALRHIFYPTVHLPHLGFVAGLALIFGAGWLSRLLSHGRIIPRIWPEPRSVG